MILTKRPLTSPSSERFSQRIAFTSKTGLMALAPTIVSPIPKTDFPASDVLIAQAKKVQLVQGNRLRMEVENGVGVSGLNFHWMRRVHHLHVATGAPRPTERT